MSKGTIIRLMDRGYGFIKNEQGEELFFHSNSLEGAEFNNLSEGQEVEFEKGAGRDGRPAAVKVSLAEAQAVAEVVDAGGDSEDAGGDSEEEGSDDGGDGE
ncbi:cold-shock protein [Chloroflexota bacterium]